MVRNNLELAYDSLFIEKIKKAFKATKPFIHRDADTFTVAGGLLPPLLWKSCDEADENHENLYQEIAPTRSAPLVLRGNTEHPRRMDIRTPLKFLDRHPP